MPGTRPSSRLQILTVVGARPQFVKAAVLSRLIRSEFAEQTDEFLLHTGQHYDHNMSRLFFDELRIPEPDVNLEVGSGSHGESTGQMLAGIEKILMERKPDLVLVYGDTNSTLAGGLAASKLLIPVAHVEAGLRSFSMVMPEEQNRVLVDRISRWLFCPTEIAQENLSREGIRDGVHVVGDVMLDAANYYRETEADRIATVADKWPKPYYLLTLHRAENTDDRAKLSSIFDALNEFDDVPCVFPAHPRTRKKMAEHGITVAPHIRMIDPVGYLEMLAAETEASFIVTDSGGVQKEAFFFRKPCITLRDETEWTETVEVGWNKLVGADPDRIAQGLRNVSPAQEWKPLYGNGNSGSRMIAQLLADMGA